MRGSPVKKFFRDQHFFLSVSRGSRKRSSALRARQALLAWPRGAVNPRSPEGRAGRREGLTAKARAEQQWRPAITLQTDLVCTFFLIPLFLLSFDYVCSIDPRRSPFASATLAASTYIRSRQAPYQGPSCNSARARGSKGGWDHSVSRRLSAMLNTDHTSNLGIGSS